MERTYLDIINELYEMINTDNINKEDKEEIESALENLHNMLWKYSA